MSQFHRFFQKDPNALPPAEVRLTDVQVEPWPDGRRVRVLLQLTPFQQNPNIETWIAYPGGVEVARSRIIENAEIRLVFTLHIRASYVSGPYDLHVQLSYPDLGVVDERILPFETHESDLPES